MLSPGGYGQVLLVERHERENMTDPFLFLASPAAPAVITNPDLSNAQPSREGYISLTIQVIGAGGTSESDMTLVPKLMLS